MRWFSMAAVVLACAAATAEEKTTLLYTFEKGDAGKLPKGWTSAKTGEGEGSVWKVIADETAPSGRGYVLAQTAAGPTKLFNVSVVEGSTFLDGEVSVFLKAVEGKIDQGGGVVWRYQNANNYCICRYNPLEENFRVYRVIDGTREQLQSKGMLTVPAGKWMKLTIRQKGKQIECLLDGKKYLEATDDAITKPGKVGLWTKADAVTHFDALEIASK